MDQLKIGTSPVIGGSNNFHYLVFEERELVCEADTPLTLPVRYVTFMLCCICRDVINWTSTGNILT